MEGKSNLYPQKHFDPNWVREGIKDRDPIDWAESFGKFLAENDERDRINGLTTTQLRKFFGQIKRVQAKGFNMKDVVMLKPQLAYAVGRDGKTGGRKTKINYFNKELIIGIDAIENDIHFNNFIDVLEAIVAYHKEKGGI